MESAYRDSDGARRTAEPRGGEPGPFFIVGAPRTGSTLLRRLLSAHSRVAIPPESGFMAEYLAADHVPLDRRKRLLCRDPEMGYWGLRPRWHELATLTSMGDCFAALHQRYAHERGKDLWGNKTPRLVHHGELLLRHFPEARFVHTVRDGRAVALSLRSSPAHRMHVRYGARRYAMDTARGLAFEGAHPDRVMRVPYEQLVSQPEATLRRVCAFLGIELEDAMLGSDAGRDLQLTPKERRSGHHAHVGRPVEPTFAGKWRRELTDTEIGMIEREAGSVLETLGYPLEAAAGPGAGALLSARVAHGVRLVGGAWDEITGRPDVWRVARRRVALGSLGSMLRDYLVGR
jgi:hypothetical protein